MLGMAIRTYSEEGKLLQLGTPGDLVCNQHFPCQPLGFWPLKGFGQDDEDEKAQTRYLSSYYQTIPGVWCEFLICAACWERSLIVMLCSNVDHGDHVLVTESKSNNAGGVIMLGRSDGVL